MIPIPKIQKVETCLDCKDGLKVEVGWNQTKLICGHPETKNREVVEDIKEFWNGKGIPSWCQLEDW